MPSRVENEFEPLGHSEDGLRAEVPPGTPSFGGHENSTGGMHEDTIPRGSRANGRLSQSKSLHTDSDNEEDFLNHQIRMLEAKKAAAKSSTWPNPGPVGLLGFATSTILLNMHNTGRFPLTTMVAAMGICVGGGAQLIAGVLEWVRGNTFGFVAFTGYGMFWLSLVCIWMLPSTDTGLSFFVQPADSHALGVFLLLWGLFTFFMLLCTLRTNVFLVLVFLSLTVLFLMLASGHMTNNPTVLRAAGYEGIVCGLLALYLGAAELLNEVWDCTLVFVVPMTQVLGWLRCLQ